MQSNAGGQGGGPNLCCVFGRVEEVQAAVGGGGREGLGVVLGLRRRCGMDASRHCWDFPSLVPAQRLVYNAPHGGRPEGRGGCLNVKWLLCEG